MILIISVTSSIYRVNINPDNIYQCQFHETRTENSIAIEITAPPPITRPLNPNPSNSTSPIKDSFWSFSGIG